MNFLRVKNPVHVGESIRLTANTSQAELTAWAKANPRLAENLRRMMNEILGRQ